MQRLRITYTVSGALRYASNLDQNRVWERAARRAGLPLAYSGGFNPRPRIQIAAALPVSFMAEAEWVDLWLLRSVELQVALEALTTTLPQGLRILGAEEVDLTEPPLPARLQAAVYTVEVEAVIPAAEVHRRVEELLAADSLPRTRRGRAYDLRPLVERLWVEAEGANELALGMALSAQEGATGRPEEVLDALGLGGGFYRVRRQRLLLRPE